MANSKVSFSFNDFKDNSCNILQKLRHDATFSDVTLACDGKQVKAHKVVLSARSNIFKDLLEQNPHPHPLIYLNGVKHSELAGILDYIYLGEATIARGKLNGFLNAADNLEIEGLTEKHETQEPSTGDDLQKCITFTPEQTNHNYALNKTNNIESGIHNATELLLKLVLDEVFLKISEFTINEMIDEVCKEVEQKEKRVINNSFIVKNIQNSVTYSSRNLNNEYSVTKTAGSQMYDIENVLKNATELLIMSVLNEVSTEVSEFTISEVIDEVYKKEEQKRKSLTNQFSNREKIQQCIPYSKRNAEANSYVIENIISNATELLVEYVLNEVYVDISESVINEVINEAFKSKTQGTLNLEEDEQTFFDKNTTQKINSIEYLKINNRKENHMNYFLKTTLQQTENIANESLVNSFSESPITNLDIENKIKKRKIKIEDFHDSTDEQYNNILNRSTFNREEAIYINDDEYTSPTKIKIEHGNKDFNINYKESSKMSILQDDDKKSLKYSITQEANKIVLNANNIAGSLLELKNILARKENYIEIELLKSAYKLNIVILDKLPERQTIEIQGNCAVIIVSDKVGPGHIDTNKWSTSSGAHSRQTLKCNTYRCTVSSCACVKKKWLCDGKCEQFCCQIQKKYNSKLSINVYLNEHNHKVLEEANSHDYLSNESRTQNDLARVIWKYIKREDCYGCTICKEEFLLKNQCKNHIKSNHFEAIEKCIFCGSCEDYFITMGAYKKHFLKYHTREESEQEPIFMVNKTKDEPPTCNLCGKIFSHRDKVKNHIKAVHEHIKNFQCNFCLNLFGRKTSIQNHLYVRHKIETVLKEHVNYLDDKTAKEIGSQMEGAYKNNDSTTCHICGKTFSRARKIKDHIKLVHDGIKNFQCNLCQRLYGSKASLQNHFELVHDRKFSSDLFTYLNDKEAKEKEHFNNKKSKRRRVNDPTKVICPKGCGGWYRKIGLRAHLRICDSQPIKSRIACPNNCSRMITSHGLRRHLNRCPGKLPKIGEKNFKKFHYKTGYI